MYKHVNELVYSRNARGNTRAVLHLGNDGECKQSDVARIGLAGMYLLLHRPDMKIPR